MKKNPGRHQRRSIRLKGYDYSQAGYYFVTISTQQNECLFGEIVDEEMIQNDAGRMIQRWFYEVDDKYANVRGDTFIVMPNHFHCIIEIKANNPNEVNSPKMISNPVGADRSVCPDLCACPNQSVSPNDGTHTTGALKSAQSMGTEHNGTEHNGGRHIGGEHAGSPLPRIVQWFKTMTTTEYIRSVKQYGWRPFPGKLWQRNYYEHIIRNETELNEIREYILYNPSKWNLDKENPVHQR